MTANACGECGADPAKGLAWISGVRYCHGYLDEGLTCYTIVSHRNSLERIPEFLSRPIWKAEPFYEQGFSYLMHASARVAKMSHRRAYAIARALNTPEALSEFEKALGEYRKDAAK